MLARFEPSSFILVCVAMLVRSMKLRIRLCHSLKIFDAHLEAIAMRSVAVTVVSGALCAHRVLPCISSRWPCGFGAAFEKCEARQNVGSNIGMLIVRGSDLELCVQEIRAQ